MHHFSNQNKPMLMNKRIDNTQVIKHNILSYTQVLQYTSLRPLYVFSTIYYATRISGMNICLFLMNKLRIKTYIFPL